MRVTERLMGSPCTGGGRSERRVGVVDVVVVVDVDIDVVVVVAASVVVSVSSAPSILIIQIPN